MKTKAVKKYTRINITFSHFRDIPYDIYFEETDVLNEAPISYRLDISNDGERYMITPTDFKLETKVYIHIEKKWIESDKELEFIKNLGQFEEYKDSYRRELTPDVLDAFFKLAEVCYYKDQALGEPNTILTLNQLDLSVDLGDYVTLEVYL